jgi:hypothetical protein
LQGAARVHRRGLWRTWAGSSSTEPTPVLTRRGLAEWLCNQLGVETPTIVGIDHAFSFPLAYFEKYGLSGNWQDFLVDFQNYWPTDEQNIYVSFIREDPSGPGLKRTGERSWLRVTETWTPSAKSVFGFGVNGEVATSTHAGLPWLLHLRRQCQRRIHFWPFDGWEIPEGKSVVAEGLPRLVDAAVPEGRPGR